MAGLGLAIRLRRMWGRKQRFISDPMIEYSGKELEGFEALRRARPEHRALVGRLVVHRRLASIDGEEAWGLFEPPHTIHVHRFACEEIVYHELGHLLLSHARAFRSREETQEERETLANCYAMMTVSRERRAKAKQLWPRQYRFLEEELGA
jgi:hypothetical protein